MRIATMYTGAGAIDYGCVRVYDDDDDGDDATLCERGKKRNLLFARVYAACDGRVATRVHVDVPARIFFLVFVTRACTRDVRARVRRVRSLWN